MTPHAIIEAGWNFLVHPIMREGGYVRYDEKTSREILRNCEQLIKDYGAASAGCTVRPRTAGPWKTGYSAFTASAP